MTKKTGLRCSKLWRRANCTERVSKVKQRKISQGRFRRPCLTINKLLANRPRAFKRTMLHAQRRCRRYRKVRHLHLRPRCGNGIINKRASKRLELYWVNYWLYHVCTVPTKSPQKTSFSPAPPMPVTLVLASRPCSRA